MKAIETTAPQQENERSDQTMSEGKKPSEGKKASLGKKAASAKKDLSDEVISQATVQEVEASKADSGQPAMEKVAAPEELVLKPLISIEDNMEDRITTGQQNKAHINHKILHDVIELVKEGNDKIQQIVEEGILLMGKTGSGKSTLATIMAGRALQAIVDDEEGRLIVDALTPLDDIIISNSKVAETKIPNKCNAKDVVIWDCPGFHDNRGIAQEIANGFYIKRLLETTQKVKFVLVVPESALDSNRGVDFIDTINQLIKSFTDVTIIDGCISLVVTGVSQGRQPAHILKSIERITNQNG